MAADTTKKHFIRIRGANVNNLKNLSVDIPRDKFVVFTGLSGSGKSSLAFDTIYAEGQRRYMESLSSFLICCLPIVTIGASLTALHYVTLKMARNEESYIIRSFFKSFKQNFKQATVINLIMLAVAAILYMDLRIVGNISGTMSQVLYIVFFAFGILYMMVFLYIYPVLAKFYNSIKNTFRNAFLMAIRHLPYTVLMAVITLLPAGVFFIKSFRIQSMAIMLLCMFGFALEAFINGHFLVKIFDNYIPADTDTQDTDLQNENSAETSSAENDHTV